MQQPQQLTEHYSIIK